MKYYELTYLISTDIGEIEIKNFQEKINSFIKDEGGVLLLANIPVRKKLTYPIKKKEEAYLSSLNFYLPSEKITDLEKKLKEEGFILRYLLLNKGVPEKMPEIVPKPILKPKKVELEELDKELEKILGE